MGNILAFFLRSLVHFVEIWETFCIFSQKLAFFPENTGCPSQSRTEVNLATLNLLCWRSCATANSCSSQQLLTCLNFNQEGVKKILLVEN